MLRQTNPFCYGAPICPLRFVGREEEIKSIMNRITGPTREAIALYGERRIGKTSLLHYLAAPATRSGWGLGPEQYGFIYLDSQEVSPFSLLLFLHSLRSLIERQIADWDLQSDIRKLEEKDSISITDLGIWLQDIIRQDREIVLLLDEFDYIIGNTDPAYPYVLNGLRSLVNKQCLTLVIASYKPITTLTQDMDFKGPPFHNIVVSISLGSFSWEEANQLIEKTLQGTGVVFSEDDRKFVYEISKGHPYWLQNACHKLFDQRIRSTTVQSKVGEPL